MKIRHATIAAALLTATSAFAGPQCTATPQDTEHVAATMRKLVDTGHTFRRMETSDGKCYELHGTNGKGTRVEIYLNPASGVIVKTNEKKS